VDNSNNLINQDRGPNAAVNDFPINSRRQRPTCLAEPDQRAVWRYSRTGPQCGGAGVRDDLSYTREAQFNIRHGHQPIREVFQPVGHQFRGDRMGGNLLTLDDSTRPADISGDPAAQAEWDNAFPLLLGSYSQTNSNINYDKSGTPLAPYTTTHRDSTTTNEFYAQDSWRIRPT